MPSGNSGINKPFDRILKSFVDEARGLFLHLLGFIPAGVEADIRPLRPETAPAVVLPDYVAVVSLESEAPFIFHAELQLNYHRNVPRGVARYGGSLAWQYQMPVKSVLLLLRQRGVPEGIPESGSYSIGDTHTTHPFKVVRLWEIEPGLVLETNNPRLLPLALLLKSSDEQLREIASILVRQGDEEALGRFLILGSFRYDKDTLDAMIGERKMITELEFLEASSITRGWRDDAVAQTRVEDARKFLRLGLRKRFPELESMAEIDGISSLQTLESLVEEVYDASGADHVRAAILSAAKSN